MDKRHYTNDDHERLCAVEASTERIEEKLDKLQRASEGDGLRARYTKSHISHALGAALMCVIDVEEQASGNVLIAGSDGPPVQAVLDYLLANEDVIVRALEDR